jgi:hypothetical protein
MFGLWLLLCVFAPSHLAAQNAPAQQREFDFLIGNWELTESRDSAGVVTVRKGETYNFEATPAGGGILGRWYINRGTQDKPDFSRALYLSGYDRGSQRWSFYYVSDRSATWYEGRQVDGRWYFHRTFEINGKAYIDRQSWRPVDPNTVIRVIEVSAADAEKWTAVFTGTYRRR